MTARLRWAAGLLRALAPDGQAEDVIGDLEEAHRLRLRRRGRMGAAVLTGLEAVEMAGALVLARAVRWRINRGNPMIQDYKLGLRMLRKFPGLTLAGGLALAIAIGIGAGWYDLSRDLFRPSIPLPGGDRLVEIEMRQAAGGGDERRLLHDFLVWRDNLRLVEDLGGYRTLERNLILEGAPPEPMMLAEITASGFRAAGVAAVLGRPLLEADEQPGAPAVVVLGYDVWQRRFGGSPDVVGRTVALGRATTTIVGVMPEGFAFPINHRMWAPLRLPSSGYAPLEGPAVRVFGRLAPGATQAQAYAEVMAVNERIAAESPRTHEHLRPRVLAYGGESPGDRSLDELALRHGPVLLILLLACANVATLVYARTATREAEIAMRYALGASRGRIIGQLLVEALVLTSVAAAAGLIAAQVALKWGLDATQAGVEGGLPFWVDPGLKVSTIVYAAGLTIAGAVMLGLLPALKVTGSRAPMHLRNLGSGGATLRFGGVWTTVMIAQVAVTVICIPAAIGITSEAVRDHRIRSQFPAGDYLAAEIELDRETGPAGDEPSTAFHERFAQIYREFERRVAEEPGVGAVTFGNRLPGMGPNVRRAELETPGAAPVHVPNIWISAVGPGYFEAFRVPVLAGRDFHAGDRESGARTVLVNEAFARRYTGGESPVGRRVRYARPGGQTPEPWFEIVGMTRDIGMTPTDLGEAPYLYHAASPAAASPLVMGIRTSRDPSTLAPRLWQIALGVDPGLRLDEVRPLEDLVWEAEIPMMVMFAGVSGLVALGLFLSAAGIFSLMSVSVSRRTREIGLRAALGAGPTRLLAGILSRAAVLVGSGLAAGNLVVLLFVWLVADVGLAFVLDALLVTSAVMLVVGLLACVEPARRALRINPTVALKDA